MKHLSNIELFYTKSSGILGNVIVLEGEEFKHAIKVMRNKTGEFIYITDGIGNIFKSEIFSVDKKTLRAKIIDTVTFENPFANIFFCIPRLKNPDRFKFTLEKCVELGVTNFIIFAPERTIAKGTNIRRWERIVLSAMKQSLRTHLPVINIVDQLNEILNKKGNKIAFDQAGDKKFIFNNSSKADQYFVFGPEGGLTEDELNLFNRDSIFSLSTNRLRSETAIIKTASLLS